MKNHYLKAALLVAISWTALFGNLSAQTVSGTLETDKFLQSGTYDQTIHFAPAQKMLMRWMNTNAEITIFTDKGNVTISTIDGSVRLDPGVSTDEAAMVFWKAVTMALPQMRETIKNQK
jgi:hypothetical protein